MSNLIPFESSKLPAAVTAMLGEDSGELIGNNAGGGFPVISIKGKVFHIVRGDEKKLITKPGDDDPASSIEVVVIRANPDRSKVFYASGYVEGSADKPTCYSNSGVSPEADAAEPQAKKCAVCPHNQWGSKITESGAKGRACSDSRRLAVAALDAVGDPMLLRVPAASMKGLEEYAKTLAARKAPFNAVVTKVGFDYSVAHPALTFKPVGWIADPEQLQAIKDMRDSEVVQQIVGLKPVESFVQGDELGEPPAATASAIYKDHGNGRVTHYSPAKGAPAPAPAAEAPAKPAKAEKTAKAADAAVAAAANTKKVDTKVEEVADGPSDKMGKTLESLLEDLDFDD